MGCCSGKSQASKNNAALLKQGTTVDLIPYDNFIKQHKGHPRDEYIELKTIGEGTYGKVIKVQQKKPLAGNKPEIRAMKKIAIEQLSTEEQRNKMVYDIQILRKLDHPSILKIFEFYKDDSFFYVVSEFCEGNDLSKRLETQHSMTEKEAANVIKQILVGINYSHKQCIAHRDLKPENVMIDERVVGNSGDYQIKIIDWGCSYQFTEGKLMTDLVGTPYFIAPELVKKQYTKAIDMWSIGAILYHLISGDYLFTGESIEEILNTIREARTWEFKGQIWKEISEDCKDLIKKFMTYDPEKRITAEEALKHKWLEQAPNKPLNKELRAESIQRLKVIKQRSEFQNIVLTYISSKLVAKNEMKDLIEAFKAIDKDGSGTLNIDEIKSYFSTLDPQELANITKKFDQNQNGIVNYTEFVNAMYDQKKMLTEDKLQQAFKFFDSDGNNSITREEIVQYFGQDVDGHLKKQDEQKFQDMMNKADQNHDGKLNYNEFKNMMLQLANVEE